jgi:hypothetical protein
MQDKRRSHRLDIKLPATVSFLEKRGQVEFATTINVSATGIRILMKEKIEKQQKLIVTLRLPAEGNIVVHAEVVWVKEVSLYGHTEYQAGIKLDDSMPADESKFVRYYARELREHFENK